MHRQFEEMPEITQTEEEFNKRQQEKKEERAKIEQTIF